ncbi:MAG: MBL fold metallo-hydrolase [Puniceicoccales bacterium]|nr:MBL fold metallo-hydrolase [Puniceicoccales bacterium]
MNIYNQLDITVDVYHLGPLRTNVGLVVRQGEGIVIDAPPESSEAIFSIAMERKIQLKALLITHYHWDHIGNASIFRERGLEVYAYALDVPFIEHVERAEPLLSADFPIESCKVDHVLNDGARFEVCELSVQTLWISGHTEGGAAYYFKDIGICFVGDTLFSGTVGRSDFPGGNKHALFKNIREKLYALSDETQVIPGHGWLTTIGKEKNENPYVRPRK